MCKLHVFYMCNLCKFLSVRHVLYLLCVHYSFSSLVGILRLSFKLMESIHLTMIDKDGYDFIEFVLFGFVTVNVVNPNIF